MEHKGDGDTNWYAWNNRQNLGRGLEELEIGGQVETIQTTG